MVAALFALLGLTELIGGLRGAPSSGAPTAPLAGHHALRLRAQLAKATLSAAAPDLVSALLTTAGVALALRPDNCRDVVVVAAGRDSGTWSVGERVAVVAVALGASPVSLPIAAFAVAHTCANSSLVVAVDA